MCKALSLTPLFFGSHGARVGPWFGLVRLLLQWSSVPGAARIEREPWSLVRGGGEGKEG